MCRVDRLEFEAEGRCHILSLYEPLEVVAKEDWEATLPKEKLDDKGNEAEAAATPTAEQAPAAATPKSGFGGRFKKKKRFGGAPNKPSSKPCSDAEAGKEDAAAEKPKPLKVRKQFIYAVIVIMSFLVPMRVTHELFSQPQAARGPLLHYRGLRSG